MEKRGVSCQCAGGLEPEDFIKTACGSKECKHCGRTTGGPVSETEAVEENSPPAGE